MIKKPLYSGAFAFLLLSFPSMIQAQTLAFPGAEGYGSYSEGGRGGEILKVTNLNDSGPGSLREAVNHDGPRTIVFEVSGIINLDSTLVISNPRITIAGQTAPGGGITIRGEPTLIETNHVIIRFLRFRPGDYNERRPDGTDWNGMDALTIRTKHLDDPDEVHNIILDHCSFSWATDENIGIWHNTRNVTIQNSIISEPLHHFPDHEQYPYPGQGLLIGSNATKISILRNLFAHNYERHPYMNANGMLDFRNNLIYNAGRRVARFNNHFGITQTVNYVNNLIVPGPSSTFEHEASVRRTTDGTYNGKVFINGNVSEGKVSSNQDNWLMVVNEETGEIFPREAQSLKPFDIINTNTYFALELPDLLVPSVGAFLPVRDPVDNRIVDDFHLRKGKLVSRPSDVLGWPKLNIETRPIDPGNSWQTLYGIDLDNPDEANADSNGNGYTNIEEFINGTHPLIDESERIISDVFPPSIGSSSTGTFSAMSYDQSSTRFSLHSNYPNPFNNSTNLHVSIFEPGDFKLEVFNSSGQLITTILNRRLLPGEYETRWNANGLSSGLYFVRLSSFGRVDTEKILLLK